MTPEPDYFTPEAVEEQLDRVALELREQDPVLAKSPTLHVVADLQRLYDQQARAEAGTRQQVRQRLLRTSAAARYLQRSQAQPTGTPSVQQPERTLEQQGGHLRHLGEHGVTLAQRSPQQKGPRIGPGIRLESRDPVPHLIRASQRWSARALALVAVALLVAVVGGLTLGLILAHRADVATPAGTIQEFALPTSCGANGCGPEGINRGPDGNLWFTEAWGNRIGRITPTGHLTEFPLPTSCSGTCLPAAITSGPDGNLWFTEEAGNKIGRITPSGRITEFPIPISTVKQGPPGINNSDPSGITSGPDGNLWFTGRNIIGRITPTGHITEFPLPTTCNDLMLEGCNPSGITSGPDGNLWFTVGNIIGRITPTGHITEFPLPAACNNLILGCDPYAITSGPDGNLWFTETGVNPETGARQFGRITPAGTIQEFAVPLICANGCFPTAIASGPDGNLWFTDNEANEIGRITPSGHLTEFPLPTASCTLQHSCGPADITSGPDGNLWFTEEAGNKIGRISP